MRTGEIDLSQPFRLVGNGFAFYPRRCHWAISVPAFQADGGGTDLPFTQGVAVGLNVLQPFRLVAGDGFAFYTQGAAIGLNVSQPFRLVVGNGFAFYTQGVAIGLNVFQPFRLVR
jgi:hypothetical protein